MSMMLVLLVAFALCGLLLLGLLSVAAAIGPRHEPRGRARPTESSLATTSRLLSV